MSSTAGKLLIATPNLGDPNFDMTIVYMLEHNDEGAVGVVVNRPTETPVGMHLPQFAALVSPPDVFFVGGPVEQEQVVGVGRVGDQIRLLDLAALEAGSLEHPDGFRLFAGYSGWTAGQLEGELHLGSWFVVEAFDQDVFGDRPLDLWRSVLQRQGGEMARFALYPDNPIVN